MEGERERRVKKRGEKGNSFISGKGHFVGLSKCTIEQRKKKKKRRKKSRRAFNLNVNIFHTEREKGKEEETHTLTPDETRKSIAKRKRERMNRKGEDQLSHIIPDQNNRCKRGGSCKRGGGCYHRTLEGYLQLSESEELEREREREPDEGQAEHPLCVYVCVHCYSCKSRLYRCLLTHPHSRVFFLGMQFFLSIAFIHTTVCRVNSSLSRYSSRAALPTS